jgi:hypothetical protein
LGRKLQQHFDNVGAAKGEASADVQEALQKLAAAVDNSLEGVGNAVRDTDVRDSASKAAQSFRDAVAASLKEASKKISGRDD